MVLVPHFPGGRAGEVPEGTCALPFVTLIDTWGEGTFVDSSNAPLTGRAIEKIQRWHIRHYRCTCRAK